ncbi:helix-turn-helix domain-containing protein [Streptomonospora salina]|uniref:Nitroimidazol reductase NimA-like FMN-containing flavoprotein (Pyridoxamine 5'-phosphate oxidase superfamily) n=1 Tax=Streptomonospora salina TaxID=104205 RepID=A0A841ECN2_9ACTN|nr:pyridoxamine 5'-phosphate oxidase family protein [Streptomonospora salina]MBB6000746.1 nitroimidazol reductase NimA-like FMN-containing flavoprotein (pyridoxamine 5'-phosphate oxidase superfamily) [Streptomonospora salina]
MNEPHSTDGGDMARRITRRRSDLGFTRAEVAERAGMDPGYVRYLERHPARLSRESLYRLSQALHTSPEHLLGADTDTPPGAAATAVPEPEIHTLTAEESRELIGPAGVGRVAFTTAAGAPPTVLPVNYALDGDAVVVRTAAGGIIARNASGPMSFQVDRIDDAMSEGWSVLVAGRARLVEDEGELAALRERHALRPWAGGDRHAWVRIEADGVTGRRVGGHTAGPQAAFEERPPGP